MRKETAENSPVRHVWISRDARNFSVLNLNDQKDIYQDFSEELHQYKAMWDAMEAVEAVIDRLLKGVEDSAIREISHDDMNLNWRKVQSSLKGWLDRTL